MEEHWKSFNFHRNNNANEESIALLKELEFHSIKLNVIGKQAMKIYFKWNQLFDRNDGCIKAKDFDAGEN